MIVTLELAPGALLAESDLSLRLGIGRTPIREALQRLAREKLVVILPRRGMFVSEVNIQSQLKLLELRRGIERLMARLAARRASLSQRRALSEIAAAMEETLGTNDDRAFMREDMRLSELMGASSQNDFAAATMNLWQGLSRRFWFSHHRETGDTPLAVRLHARLARAISDGDENCAEEAATCLLDYLEEFTRATVLNSTG
ncbi:MAG: GntR family transcriptional regulator [Vulcanimicrobiaceae bacterium]